MQRGMNDRLKRLEGAAVLSERKLRAMAAEYIENGGNLDLGSFETAVLGMTEEILLGCDCKHGGIPSDPAGFKAAQSRGWTRYLGLEPPPEPEYPDPVLELLEKVQHRLAVLLPRPANPDERYL